MIANDYSYFDEIYFQDGKQRGTDYSDYKNGARDSKTFRELAYAIRDVFKPRRVLDVGCATGGIVRWLNEIGCEAHGVDVSEWAVKNAQHPNVRLSSADNLPFDNDFFDLVISCHSLEHLQDQLFDQSLREINRVASAFQFHMLPMIGTPPYDGDPCEVRLQLQKDPTHHQLHSKDFWIQRFRSLGCVPIDTCILLKNDNTPPELSVGQFLLKKSPLIDESKVLGSSFSRNQRVFHQVQLIANAQYAAVSEAPRRLAFRERAWKDIEKFLGSSDTLNLQGKRLQLVVIVTGNPGTLRFAAGQDTPAQEYASVGEFFVTAQPGCNVYTFSVDQMRTLRGAPNYGEINHLGFGGENENCEIVFYLADNFGKSLLA